MRVLIYGAGALGQALGCLLAANGCKVNLILRDRFIGPVSDKGLSVSGIFGDYHVDAGKIEASSTLDPVLERNFDYVIITTKSYDTDGAIEDIRRLSDKDCIIVSMQNGCGNLEKIVASFGDERALAARVITGFEISEPGKVIITATADAIHIGGSRVGEIPDAAVKLAQEINKSGLPCESTDNVQRDLYAKLLFNCALNPLGAILGVHYGVLADNDETRKIMNRVISETFDVIKALGGTTPWSSAEEYQRFFYEKQIPVVYKHRPSMLQDIENGKRTEVEALTGYVTTQGRKHGLPTPTCDLLSYLVRFKELGNYPG